MEPAPSEPWATGPSPAATAAPAPPAEAPDVRSSFHGFRHGGPSKLSHLSLYPKCGAFGLPRRSPHDPGLGCLGLLEREVGRDREKRVDHGVQAFDALQNRFRQLEGGQCPRLDEPPQLQRRRITQICAVHVDLLQLVMSIDVAPTSGNKLIDLLRSIDWPRLTYHLY